jgi:hypothetical protein
MSLISWQYDGLTLSIMYGFEFYVALRSSKSRGNRLYMCSVQQVQKLEHIPRARVASCSSYLAA